MGTQTNSPLMPDDVESFTSRLKREGVTSEALTRTASDALRRFQDMIPKIEQFCRERPLTAIGIGVVAGILLRRLLSRRRD